MLSKIVFAYFLFIITLFNILTLPSATAGIHGIAENKYDVAENLTNSNQHPDSPVQQQIYNSPKNHLKRKEIENSFEKETILEEWLCFPNGIGHFTGSSGPKRHKISGQHESDI